MLFYGSLQRPVYPGYDAVKQVGVHLLGQSISGIDRPLLRLRLHQRLGRQNDPPMAQPAHQLLRLHGQQLAEEDQVWVTELQERKATLKGVVVRSPPLKRDLRLTDMDELSRPESRISTLPKCKMAANTLKTLD